MSQPPPYTRQYDFSDYQDDFPDQPLPGNQVDNELNAVRTSLNAAINNLGLIQADDGDLRNATVAPENLDTDVLSLFSNNLTFKGNWATATLYTIGDVVRYIDGATYLAAADHTSGTFDTDLTAGDWVLFANPVGALGDIVFQKHDGDANEDTFSLPVDIIDEKQLFVYVEGLIQDPETAYTVSGNSITFAAPPPLGTGNILIFGIDMTAVVSANEAENSALLAEDWASKTDGQVIATEFSAKAWAIGGTNVTSTASRGASKEWAITTGATVDGTDYGSKEHAVGTTVTTGSSKDWASKTNGLVQSVDGSAKAWAVGGTGVSSTASAGAAKEWATTTGGTVDTSEYSAKEYATGTTVTTGSAKDWATKTNGLVQTVDGSAKAWAIGGTGVTATASAGAAKEWATKTSAAVDTSDFSAKEYAQGTQASTGGSAKNWAQQTGADVTGAAANSRSAKAWAQSDLTGATLGGSSKDWAQTTGGTVDGTGYSSKEHAVGTSVATGSAKEWASKTTGLVQSVDGSAKAWAVGGTGVTTTASAGAAKEWATTTGGAVDTSEYSSKEYAVGTTAAVGSSKSWATKTSAAVGGGEFSAKEYAQGSQASTGGSAKNWAQQTGADVTGAAANSRSAKSWAQDANTGATLGGSAKDWAQTTGGTVDGTGYSSKEHAVGTTTTTGSAKDWATKTSSTVIASNYSAKEWATGTQTRGASSGGSAKDWANYTGGTVDDTEYSAKKYAQDSSTSATASASSATSSAASAAAAAATLASALWRDVVFITSVNSPYSITSAHNGKLIVCDTSGGAISITLPQISTLTLPFQVGIKKESSDTTAVTINRAGTDTIDGSTSKTVSTASSGSVLIADTDPAPDIWTCADFGAVAGNMTSDIFSGTGAQTDFTLSVAPGSVNNVAAFISGVRQRPTTDYTLSGTTLTFTSAPASGTNNILCVTGTTLAIGTPADATVTAAKIVDGAITASKLAAPTSLFYAGTSGGTANAQTLTPTPALAAYAAGVGYTFKVSATNTSKTVTLAVSGLATRNVKKFVGGTVSLLAVGDLTLNSIAYVVDDGTQFILMNPLTAGQAADITSATTTDLTTAEGDYGHITGTTTITAVTLQQGRLFMAVFDGALTFTHNATSLILPGGANITTAAGDVAFLFGEGSSNVRCIDYVKKSGKSVIAPADADITFTDVTTGNASTSNHGFLKKLDNSSTNFMNGQGNWAAPPDTNQVVLLATANPSNAATVDFTSVMSSSYSSYFIIIKDAIFGAGAGVLLVRTATDNSTFDATSAHYLSVTQSQTTTTVTAAAGTVTTGVSLTPSINTVVLTGRIEWNRGVEAQAADSKSGAQFHFMGTVDTAIGWLTAYGGNTAGSGSLDVNAVRLLHSAVNWTSGNVLLYGVKNT